VGAEANQRSGSGEKNSDIIRETSRRPEEICKADEETNIRVKKPSETAKNQKDKSTRKISNNL
jgi:hypothetical protein